MTTDQRQPMPVAPKGYEAQRVKAIYFCQPNGRDLSGFPGSNGGLANVTAGERMGGTVEIQFEPWIRHHRVRYTSSGKVLEWMVPESWCTFTPAEMP